MPKSGLWKLDLFQLFVCCWIQTLILTIILKSTSLRFYQHITLLSTYTYLTFCYDVKVLWECFSTGISKENCMMHCFLVLDMCPKRGKFKIWILHTNEIYLNKQGLSCAIFRPSSSTNIGLKRSILRGSVVELDK